MKSVLVVFEEIPENTNLFLVEAEDETVEIFKTAHGYYMGVTNQTPEQEYALEVVNLMFGERSDDNLEWAHGSGIPHEFVGMYADCAVPDNIPLEPAQQIDLVIRTGYMM